MCVFKAMLISPSEQHTELSEMEFYDFYEVQNLKWREITAEGEDVPWFEHFPRPIKMVFLKIHVLVKWEWFNSIIYLVVLANAVFLILYTAFITESEADNRFKRLNIVLPISFIFLFGMEPYSIYMYIDTYYTLSIYI
jgi:membrane protein insertase Oxa1/YidC/SpoIIIJ